MLWVVFGFLAALIYVAWARSSGASGERPNGAGGPGEAGSRILAGVLAWPLVAAVLSLAPGRSFGTALWSASVLLVGIGTLSYVTHGEPPRLDSPGGATRFLRDRRHR